MYENPFPDLFVSSYINNHYKWDQIFFFFLVIIKYAVKHLNQTIKKKTKTKRGLTLGKQ